MNAEGFDQMEGSCLHIHVWIVEFLNEFLDTISRNKIDFNVILEMLRVWRRKIGECHTIITECLDTSKSGFPNSPVRITKSFD